MRGDEDASMNAADPAQELLKSGVSLNSLRSRVLNLYVIHGGTSFGFTAGANSGGKGYEPDVTSYDYDAPIDEQGRATTKYYALRDLLAKYRPASDPQPAMPEPVSSMTLQPVPMRAYTSLWANLGTAVESVQPKPMEAYGQDY